MDLLQSQLDNIQQRLAFVAVEPIDWKFYVQATTWAVTLFESYLLYVHVLYRVSTWTESHPRLRQYPLFSKTEPPKALAGHFTPELFEKSQKYGKDKAKFALVTGLYKQALDSGTLHFGLYAWSWDVAGQALAKYGYGSEYEVCCTGQLEDLGGLRSFFVIDHSIPRVYDITFCAVLTPDPPNLRLSYFRSRREARFQQDDSCFVCR
jgi:hypothetical protein